jgi:FkbM family methyltransferase
MPCSKGSKGYGSQGGQDRWVAASAANTSLYFVDLAANDAECLSNTVRLERELGWRGLCIEPNPKYTARLKQLRSCGLVQAPVSSDEREVSFAMQDDRGRITAPHAASSSTPGVRTMRTRRLDTVLDEARAPNVVEYLSLDIEGHEEDALCDDFAWRRYTFLLITVELPSPRLNARLFLQGYLFARNAISFKLHDTFYVHASHPRAVGLASNGSFEQLPAHCSKPWAGPRLPSCKGNNWFYCCEYAGYPANGTTRYPNWHRWRSMA